MTRRRTIGNKSYSFKATWELLLFCLPGLIVTFIYSYLPLWGVQIAFFDYNPRRGIAGSTWVGWENFERFFQSANAWNIIGNTLILSVYSLAVELPLAILFALALNALRHKRYRKVVQTVTYAPQFISTIVMCGMITMFLSPRIGIVNTLIQMLGGESVNFLDNPAWWRHIYVWSGVWQSTGWNSLIFYAALSRVDPEHHEAAIMDGATRFQRVRYIDLPALKPIAALMLLLRCGSMMSIGYEKALALQNDLNLSVSQIISTYVYQMGLLNRDISFSTAIDLFNSAVNLVLLVLVYFVTRRLSDEPER